MELDAVATLEAEPTQVFAALEDLATYPHWLTIVGRAEPAVADAADPGPAWMVELVGRVGPFTRTKQVRMVRTRHDRSAGDVCFERCERDGRSHNTWVLTGSAAADAAGGTRLHVHLRYGGGRTLPGADLLLRQEAARAGARLGRYLRSGE